MGLILDSSILISDERGRLDLVEFLRSVAGQEEVAISSITASELLHGVERADTPARKQRREAYVTKVRSDFPVFSFGLDEARSHAHTRAALERDGRSIGAHDLLIAATALARGCGLATLNIDEFNRIAGLRVVDATPFCR